MKLILTLTILFTSLTLLRCRQSNNIIWEKDSVNVGVYKHVAVQLDSIYEIDQRYRIDVAEVLDKYGSESHEYKERVKLINTIDSLNLIEVRLILEKYGWLGINEVGETANSAIFLVIQHSNKNIRKRYLSMMRQSVKLKKVTPEQLALLEDRIAIDSGIEQIYGTQFGRNDRTHTYYLLPLIDPENVDKRRKEIGMEPLSESLQKWNIDWKNIKKNK